MGVDAKWGRFQFVPKCPVLSTFVLFCPDLSPFRAPRRTKEDKRGQNGTFRDKLGNAPFSIYPHLALLNCDSNRELQISSNFERVLTISEELNILTCCRGNWRWDSNSDLNRGSNHKPRDSGLWLEALRVARLQNEIAPESFKLDTKKGSKKAKESEKVSETYPKSYYPVSGRLKISHRYFFSSKTKGPGEEGAAGYCPKILLPNRAKNGALFFP